MKCASLILILSSFFHLHAQPITNFTLFDVVSNDSVSLKQYANRQGVALIFTSNECAFDSYYANRIKVLVDAYSDKIQFLLVNANQELAESIETMRETSTKRKINAPYLSDKNQVALTLLDVKKTPEVFLLKSTSGKFTLAYSGALDDNPQVATDVKQNYLKDAIDKLLAGQKSAESTRAVGCTIRRK